MRGLALSLGLALVILLAASIPAPADAGQFWTRFASDPEVYALGWTTAHWASSIERMVVWGGHSHNYKGNNAVRAFDPVGNRWEVLYPNSNGARGVTNRDNHVSFYVPRRGTKGELWVLGGAYTTGYPCPEAPGGKCPKGTNFGGRFDLATRQWVNMSTSPAEFGTGLIRGFGAFKNYFPAARGWCEAIDTGAIFAGYSTDLLQIIEPNPGGPEPYRYWSRRGGGPGPRTQVQNNATCVGDAFYLYGGLSPKGESLRDLWRLDVRTGTWKQLASAPVALYQPVVTHDAPGEVLVLYGGSTVLVYRLKTDTWEDITPALREAGEAPPARKNQVGAYSPVVGQHLYTGGILVARDGGVVEYRDNGRTDGFAYRATARAAAATGQLVQGGARALPVRRDSNAILAAAQPASNASPRRVPDIPLQTWVARRLPGPGKAPWGEMKHMRLAHNPADGRIYFLGGDYSGPGGYQSGRNEVYSYSVLDDEWRQEYPYCGPPGTVQPSHPDEVGWVYDTKRSLFWMLPGYMGKPQGNCPGSALVRGEIMTFDPAARQWSRSRRKDLWPSTAGSKTFAQYDPVTDSLIRFAYAQVETYDIEADSWSVRKYAFNARLGYEYTAFDPKSRRIYMISPLESRLYAYSIDEKTLAPVSDTPPVGARPGFTRPVWDPVNSVLLWFQFVSSEATGKFHVYHPATNTWERDLPIRQPEGLRVRGNNVVFDPLQNVLLLLGGTGEPNPHLFLYRYGAGARTE